MTNGLCQTIAVVALVGLATLGARRRLAARMRRRPGGAGAGNRRSRDVSRRRDAVGTARHLGHGSRPDGRPRWRRPPAEPWKRKSSTGAGRRSDGLRRPEPAGRIRRPTADRRPKADGRRPSRRQDPDAALGRSRSARRSMAIRTRSSTSTRGSAACRPACPGPTRRSYYNSYQIMQKPGYVVILYEWNHMTRIIPLDGRPHLDPADPAADGRFARPLGGQHARRGRDQLQRRDLGARPRRIAEGAAGETRPTGHGIVHSPELHVVERFTPRGQGLIRYEATIEDPKVFTRRSRSRSTPCSRERRPTISCSNTRVTKGTATDILMADRRRHRPSSRDSRGPASDEEENASWREALLVTTLGVVLLVGGRLVAHHAFSAEFDAGKPIKLQGTVTKVEWINPHSWIHIDVKGNDRQGRELDDRVRRPEPAAAPRLNKNSMPAGTEVVVDGFRAKDGSATANGGRHHAAGRQEVLRRLVGHRRAL